MNEATSARERKVRIYIVRDAQGRVVWRGRATSTIQARAFYIDELSVSAATDSEVFAMGKLGVVLGGLAEEPGLQGQQALLDNEGNAHDPGVLIQNERHPGAGQE